MRELLGTSALASQDFRIETVAAFKVTKRAGTNKKTLKRSRKIEEKR